MFLLRMPWYSRYICYFVFCRCQCCELPSSSFTIWRCKYWCKPKKRLHQNFNLLYNSCIIYHKNLAGESAVFEVALSAAPDGLVWLKDNKPLSESKLRSIRSTKSNGDRSYRLEIKETEVGDAGLYTAIATNAAGKTTCSAPLVVHGC